MNRPGSHAIWISGRFVLPLVFIQQYVLFKNMFELGEKPVGRRGIGLDIGLIAQ